MKLLFWNTQKKDLYKYIASMVLDNDIDFVALAELQDTDQLSKELDSVGKPFVRCFTIGSTIEIWCSAIKTIPDIQDHRYSIQIVNDEFIICCVHLQSDLYYSKKYERLETIRKIMEDIRSCEDKTRINKIIVIGDFNEMPYETGCLGANGFHGLPALSVEDKPHRIIDNVRYRKYYNPMWNLFGDNSKPPGTFYYNQSKMENPMWYMFDQIIISQEVIPYFNHDSLRIITDSTFGRLDNAMGRPSVSDHFPIMCEIIAGSKEVLEK